MTFEELVRQFVDLINLVIPILFSLALVLFLWGGVRYIYKEGDAKGKSEERSALGWGLLALFILFSIWGIIRLLEEAFLGV